MQEALNMYLKALHYDNEIKLAHQSYGTRDKDVFPSKQIIIDFLHVTSFTKCMTMQIFLS